MKFSLSLLVFTAIVSSFSGCTTLANRRDVYRPADAGGPHTKRYAQDRRNEGVFGISQDNHHPKGRNEGIFGVSNSDARYYTRSHVNGGIFGISRSRF